jgi:hypothetical protein
MMDTLVCLLPDSEHVATAKRRLNVAGYVENEISVLDQPADVWRRLDGHQKFKTVAKKAAIGALLGLVIGALYGVPSGVLMCRFMNCPLETGVVMWVLISLFWVIAAGILGALIGLNELEYDLYSYVEGVRRGELLFVVKTPEKQVPDAVRILRQEFGTVIHTIHEETSAR